MEKFSDTDDVSYDYEPFDITSTRFSATEERLKRWRQAAMVLNASRRFRYTIDSKTNEEKQQILKKTRAHVQAIRAAPLLLDSARLTNGYAEPEIPIRNFGISRDQWTVRTRDLDSYGSEEYGEARELSKTNLDKGIHRDEVDADSLAPRKMIQKENVPSQTNIDETRRLLNKNNENGDLKISLQELQESKDCMRRKAKTNMETSQIMSEIEDDGDGHIGFEKIPEFSTQQSQFSMGYDNETLEDTCSSDGDMNVNLRWCHGEQSNVKQETPLEVEMNGVMISDQNDSASMNAIDERNMVEGNVTGEREETQIHPWLNTSIHDHGMAIQNIVRANTNVEPPLQNSTGSLGIRKQVPKPENVWLYPKKSVLMLVATVIATVAFQAGIMPPGGAWQEDMSEDANGKRLKYPRKAGMAIMAYNQKEGYELYLLFNTMAFLSSLSIILSEMIGLPMDKMVLMRVQMVFMWISICAMVTTYFVALRYMFPDHTNEKLKGATGIVGLTWLGLIVIVVFLVTLLHINRWFYGKYGRGKNQPAVSVGEGEGEEPDEVAVTIL